MSALEHQIDQIVAPLGAIRPATRGSGRPVARRHTALGAAVAVLLAAVALGATWAVLDATATPDEGPTSPGRPLACLGLVGGTAAHAEQVAKAAGYTVQWRFEVWDPGGRSSNEVPDAKIPADAVVEQVAVGTEGQLFIIVHAADDPNAPPICALAEVQGSAVGHAEGRRRHAQTHDCRGRDRRHHWCRCGSRLVFWH